MSTWVGTQVDLDAAVPPSDVVNSVLLTVDTAKTVTMPSGFNDSNGIVVISCDAFMTVRFDGTNPPVFGDKNDGSAGMGIPANWRAPVQIPKGCPDIRVISHVACNATFAFYKR